MKAEVELFLHSSEYRKILIRRIVQGVFRVVLKPINYIKARSEAHKLLKEHPDNWDMYVEAKKLEQQAEENDRLRQITELRTKIKSNLTLMQIAMLTYIAKLDPSLKSEKKRDVSVDEIDKQFVEFKQKALTDIEKCNALGAVGQEELTEVIQGCSYDSCQSVSELKAFSKKLCNLLEDFDYGKAQ